MSASGSLQGEADGILLLALAAYGIPEHVKTCADVDTDTLFSACRLCLAHILPGGFHSEPLPSEPSRKFRACVDLADAIQRAGYENKLGFHQFLYPSANDTRALLGFLAARLPKRETSAEVGDKPERGLSALAETAVRRAVEAYRRGEARDNQPSRAPFWHETDVARLSRLEVFKPLRYTASALHFAAVDVARLQAREARRLRRLASSTAAPTSALTSRRRKSRRRRFGGVTSTTTPTRAKTSAPVPAATPVLQTPPSSDATGTVSATPEATVRKQELQNLQEASAAAAEREEAARAAEARDVESMQMAQSQLETSKADASEANAEAKMYAQASASLQSHGFDETVAMLDAKVSKYAEQMRSLQAEFEQAAAPLQAAAMQGRARVTQALSAAEERLAEFERLRAEVAHLRASASEREAEQNALLAEYESRSAKKRAAPNADVFVSRIYAIVKQVRKQDADIQRIVANTRRVNRELNAQNEALERVHAVVDDLTFRDAKSQAEKTVAGRSAREAYRTVAGIHGTFARLRECVAAQSRAERTRAVTEARLERLEQETPDSSRLDGDLSAVRADVEALVAKLRANGLEPCVAI